MIVLLYNPPVIDSPHALPFSANSAVASRCQLRFDARSGRWFLWRVS